MSSGAVQRLPLDGGQPTTLTTVVADGPVFGGSLRCLRDVLVVEAVGSPTTTITVLDRVDGAVVGEPLTVEGFGTALVANPAEGSIVVTHAPDTGEAWLVDGAGVRPVGSFEPSTGPFGARGAPLDGAVVDLRKVATDPASDEPFTAVVPG